jgi:hypothetical protein
MSNRSKSLLANVAVIGIAAIASSRDLTAKPAPQEIASAPQVAPVSLQH